MPFTTGKKRQFKPQRSLVKDWDSFRQGVNTELRDSELGPEQVKEMTNMQLSGKGIAETRPGSGSYYQASTNGKVRGIFGSKISDTVDVLSISDDGYLTKKNGSSFTVVAGASWASGYKVRMVQLQNKVYIVQPGKPLTRFDGTTLLSYTTLTSPTNLRATNISGATGTYTWSWRVAALTDAGRTLASDPVVLANLPEDLTMSAVKVSWTAPSAASGLITGYEIYGREQGTQSRITGVQPSTTEWIDFGDLIPSQIAGMPDFNETGGPNAKYIIKSKGKIVLANLTGAKSRFMWSGADVYLGKFHYTRGGGYLDIDPDDGTEITGTKEVSENRIIIWKERTIYQVTLEYNSDLGIVEPKLQKITDLIGCLSGDTIQPYSNDTAFVGRSVGGGVSINTLGYQPNILANVLRTAELSAANRPILETINASRFEDMWALWFNNAYYFFYPVGSVMRCIVMDYQRSAMYGPYNFPYNPITGAVVYDSSNKEHFLYGGGDNGNVYEISEGYSTDDGADINWSFTTKKEDFGLQAQLKTLLTAFVHLADLQAGSVNVEVVTEGTSGNARTTTSFTVTPANTLAGWGSFPFGKGVRWGSPQQASKSTTNTSDIRKTVDLNESNIVSAQARISGNGKCKIVAIQLKARPEPGEVSDWLVS